ncbi:MAG TPA: 16S rRNA (cytidine(1402)-2'-O)-methyltransferase [Sediminispirochaeta sp.]|nr:16S rRNA (cytidine(1402)-2'-O)-methyltransferase [Sediminispirochaeta sp.]
MATLYIVATPIGNLQDITFRALETLRGVDTVACEDTRHTGKLLKHFEISKPLLSCRSQNEEQAAVRIIGLLREGRDVAYVSDAGTPGLSDPGARLVQAVRREGIPVVPIPGPSALTTLISASGMTGRSFIFDGFLSPKAGKRQKRLDELLEREENFVLYESPHRIVKILAYIAEKEPGREVFLGRELTKLHEERLYGTALELFEDLNDRKSIKGEIVILVSGKKKS